jgi:hypothetical protein
MPMWSLRYRAHDGAPQCPAALLKMAKSTSDPDLAAKLVGAAADLKDQAGELPAPTKPPDVLMEE